MTRVLCTPEAQAAASTMSSIVDGGLTEQITQLKQQGTRLSDPSVWDGMQAARFRDNWTVLSGQLDRAREVLDEVHAHAQQVHTAIFEAGN